MRAHERWLGWLQLRNVLLHRGLLGLRMAVVQRLLQGLSGADQLGCAVEPRLVVNGADLHRPDQGSRGVEFDPVDAMHAFPRRGGRQCPGQALAVQARDNAAARFLRVHATQGLCVQEMVRVVAVDEGIGLDGGENSARVLADHAIDMHAVFALEGFDGRAGVAAEGSIDVERATVGIPVAEVREELLEVGDPGTVVALAKGRGRLFPSMRLSLLGR